LKARSGNATQRLALALAGLTALGTAGYVPIEGMEIDDPLFMTVITLSTVGYGETVPLSAHESNPDIAIHARAETEAGIHRLRMSGASQIVSPHRLGGQRIANAIVRPGVVEFLELSAPGDGAEVDLEEVVLAEGSQLVDKAISDLRDLDLRVAVIAIKRGTESLNLQPDSAEVLRAGDRVVVGGDHDDLGRLADLSSPTA